MFDINDKGQVIIKPELLTLEVFIKLKEKYKNEFEKICAYIYFTTDFKSPYKKSFGEDELKYIVANDLGLKEYKDTTELQEATSYYKKMQQTKSIQLFEAAQKSVDEMIKYYRDFSIDNYVGEKRDEVIGRVMNNMGKLASLISSLEETRKKVEQELSMQDNNIRGSKALRKREQIKR